MDKTAQQRSMLSKLREKINISGRVLEALNSEFSAVMSNARETDEKIRDHASDVRVSARNTVQNVRRRDYLAAAMDMAGFHERCKYIAAELERFIKSVDLKHYTFLLDQIDDEDKEKLFAYNPDFEVKLDSNDVNDLQSVASLEKTADWKDWLWQVSSPLEDVAHNFTTGRGVAMRALEKRFNVSFLKELKKQSVGMSNRTWRFLQYLLASFKRLSSAIAKRKLGKYIDFSKDFIKKFKEYHTSFTAYYNKVVAPLKEQHQSMTNDKQMQEYKKEQDKKQKLQELAKELEFINQQNVGQRRDFVAPSGQQSSSIPVPPKSEQKLYEQPALSDVLAPESENVAVPLQSKKPKVENLRDRANENFINKLHKNAITDNPQEMIMEILKYSETLEDVDNDKSLQLLAIAEGIMDEYKTAGVFDFMKSKKPEENTTSQTQETTQEQAPTKEKQTVPFHNRQV